MVIKVMKELYKEGGMPDVLPDAENYFKKMIKTGGFCGHALLLHGSHSPKQGHSDCPCPPFHRGQWSIQLDKRWWRIWL